LARTHPGTTSLFPSTAARPDPLMNAAGKVGGLDQTLQRGTDTTCPARAENVFSGSAVLLLQVQSTANL